MRARGTVRGSLDLELGGFGVWGLVQVAFRVAFRVARGPEHVMADYDGPIVTITFGDCAENHVGMQKVGTQVASGLSCTSLVEAKEMLEKAGATCELVDLSEALVGMSLEHDEASVLIIRNGVETLLGPGSADTLLTSLTSLSWDTKAKMYGRVVNKHARHNLCFGSEGQAPDYEAGKGTIVAFDDVPALAELQAQLPAFFGTKCSDLVAEGNLYFDRSCGIGFHGDAERRIVVALRLGGDMPLDYQWFKSSRPVGSRVELMLCHGDMYVMSEKAVGADWRRKKVLTLRHAAGAAKFRKIGVGSLKRKPRKRKKGVKSVEDGEDGESKRVKGL